MSQNYTLPKGAAEVCRRVGATRRPGGEPITQQSTGELRAQVSAGRVHVHDETKVRVAWFDLPQTHDRPGVPFAPGNGAGRGAAAQHH